MSDHKFWITSLLLLALVFFLRYLYLQRKHNAATRSSARLVQTMKEARLRKEEIWALFDDILDEIGKVEEVQTEYVIIQFKTSLVEDDVQEALALIRDAGYNVVLLAEGRVIYWPNLITANKNL